jgi:hypothetical protein
VLPATAKSRSGETFSGSALCLDRMKSPMIITPAKCLEALEKVSGGTKANLKGAEKQLGNIIMDGLSFAGGALAGAGAAIFEGAVNAPSNPHQL